jgi:hypothetical protein
MKRQLFFLHTQKTGGAALTGSIANRLAAADCLLLYYSPEPDVGELDAYRYVSGHVPLSFADRFAEPPFTFTFLRDPVERALSAYSFYRTRPPEFADQLLLFGRGREAYERARECLRLCREGSIEDLIRGAPSIAAEYFGNRQARVLGDAAPEGGEELLGDALRGLERCDFIGLSERLDESALWLTRRLGWQPLTPLPQINVTSQRIRRDQVSSGGLEALHRLTSVDRELYGRAVVWFGEQLARWAGEEAERDPAADIPDAEAVGDLRFDRGIRGGGWVGREWDPDGTWFCWLGGSRSAWVELASDGRANAIVVEIAHTVDGSILEGLQLSVNGRRLEHRLESADHRIVLTGPLPRRRLGRTGAAKVTLDVDRTVQPRDVNPDSHDDRELAIAVRRIALVSR